MRAPRYRFPNEVRSTTRTMASRMVQDDAIPQTPEELETWISETPDVEQSLEKGGYNTAFTAHDLFPLLQVFIAQAAPDSGGDAPPRAANRGWLVPLLVLALLATAVAVGVLW